MKRLPEEFRKGGFTFTVLRRSGLNAILAQRGAESLNYVVAQIQQHETRQIAGITIEAAEALPSDSQWGSKAWTYLGNDEGRSMAENKFKQIQQ